MPTINDPNGTPAAVDEEFRLSCLCVSISEEHHANKDHGSAYTWQFANDPKAADDCIFYIKNDDDRILVLEGIDLNIGGACEVYLKVGGSGTTSAGTTVTGTNLNPGSGEVAEVTCLHDEDVEGAGTFAGAVECNRWIYSAAKDTYNINFPVDLIIPKNQVFTLWVDTISIAIEGTLYGYFHH